jgi:D-amino-acid oxidase
LLCDFSTLDFSARLFFCGGVNFMAHRDTHNLPTPNFTFDPDATGACIAGVRPYRNPSYRLEAETISNRFFVHNYGHGGAAITLSWGCAAKVRDIVGAYLVGSKEKSVAVLGAGVMGLTAATRMLDLGLDVTIYSDRLPAQTTSAKAGGHWAVSVVEFDSKKAELTEIIKTACTTFKASIGQGFGVHERPNYTAPKSHNLDIVLQLAPGLIPPRQSLPKLPFQGHTKPGFVYQTLLIEPPIFLARLEADLRTRGAGLSRGNLPARPISSPRSRRRLSSTAPDWDR